MSGRFVRASKYRHVLGEPNKKLDSYTEVKAICTGEGNYIAANAKYFAVSKQGGGGPVLVHALEKRERFANNHPVLNVHTSKVLDMDWNPFMDSLLATASEDCLIKVSVIPEGFETNVNEAAVTLQGHEKKLGLIHFHPTANNVLGSCAYDHMVKLWDIEAQAELKTFNDHAELIQSFEWNGDGSMIASTSKDKKIRLFDPRVEKSIACVDGHPGGKSSRAVWMNNRGWLGVVGFSKTSMRKVGLWDPRKMDEQMHELDLDQSAGVIMPYYDEDSSILYLSGKGDGTIRYYEMVDEAPYIHFLSDYRSNDPQKGIAYLPKLACDTANVEILKILRLCRDWVEPVAMKVPRKSDMFQKDLYPDTYAGIPAMTAAEYMEGKNKPAPTVSMAPGASSAGAAQTMTFTAKKSPAELQKELDAALARIKELEAEVASLKA